MKAARHKGRPSQQVALFFHDPVVVCMPFHAKKGSGAVDCWRLSSSKAILLSTSAPDDLYDKALLCDAMWFLPSALNVKVKRFVQAQVNGGSNYDSLKVAKCLAI